MTDKVFKDIPRNAFCTREISERMGIPLNTVGARLSREANMGKLEVFNVLINNRIIKFYRKK